ncbi:MAG: glutathione S-transferase [Gammaproteobacteria bacterium SG8_11]|nr:MAG: glutathione S-transferase [Gammaproteobacteria bacterium SG8_11]
MHLELISFKICPFVQRAVITLLEKKIDFDINYIDLKHPPDWFLEISPFGKVPVLRVDDKVLFESAIIVEYLDEISPPSLHPSDPFRKAENRAWIEFGSNINVEQYSMLIAKDQTAFEEKFQALRKDLQRLEQQLGAGPYFNGEQFSLVDAAYAPPLMRFNLIERYYDFKLFENCPKSTAWQKTLLSRESVQHSVVQEFETLFTSAIRDAGGYAAQWFLE